MPIGSVPANTTRATAQEFTLDATAHFWEFTQASSWYPNGDVFIPLGQPGHVASTPFELWYKCKPISPEFVAYYSTWGATVWNLGNGTTYRPDQTAGCNVSVSNADGSIILVYGMRVQFYTNTVKDGYYYFQIFTPPSSYAPVTSMKIRVDVFHRSESNTGAIVVQDSLQSGAAVVLSGTGEFLNADAIAKHIFVAETGHSIGGQAGDILPMSGITCIQDTTAGGVSLRDKDYNSIITFPIGTPIQIRRDSTNSTFWISYTDGSNVGFIRSLTVGAGGTGTAVLGPTFSPDGVGIGRAKVIGVYNNQILYYSLYADPTTGETNIRRWNLQTNATMPVFYPGSDTLGELTGILALPNGEVIAGFRKTERYLATLPFGWAYRYIYSVRKFNSNGNIIGTLNFAPSQQHSQLAYGETSEFFYIWQHFSNSGYLQSGFAKVKVSDLIILNWAYAPEFQNQALLHTGSLYRDVVDGHTPQSPIISWGSDRGQWTPQTENSPGDVNPATERFGNFWINPFVILVPPVIITPPPIEPPPINPNIGGGLIMLDPANTVRHDVYLSHTGQPIDVSIQVYIRTAFLGD